MPKTHPTPHQQQSFFPPVWCRRAVAKAFWLWTNYRTLVTSNTQLHLLRTLALERPLGHQEYSFSRVCWPADSPLQPRKQIQHITGLNDRFDFNITGSTFWAYKSFRWKANADCFSLVTCHRKMELLRTKPRNYLPSGKGLKESEVFQSKLSLGSSKHEKIKCFQPIPARARACVYVCVSLINFFTAQLFTEHPLRTHHWGSNG